MQLPRISLDEFNAFLNELEKAFNRKYSEKQVEVFYAALQRVPKPVYDKALSSLIKKSRYLPDFSSIEDVLHNEQRLMTTQIKDPVKPSAGLCRTCYGGGIVQAYRKEAPASEAPFIFKCNCHYGSNRIENYPFWNDADKKHQFKKLDYHDLATKNLRKEFKAKGLQGNELFHAMHQQAISDGNLEKYFVTKIRSIQSEKKVNREIGIVRALKEIKDISRLAFPAIINQSSNLARLQETLIAAVHGKDQVFQFEDQTFIESFKDFCSKFQIKHNLTKESEYAEHEYCNH